MFHGTVEQLTERLVELTARPFRDATNEDVADALWAGFDGWTTPEIQAWGGNWRLDGLELAVRGVRDRIGHSDGWTRYGVARPAEDAEGGV